MVQQQQVEVAHSPARQHPRYEVDILAIRAKAPPRLDRVLNLSRRGAMLETRAALPVGTAHTFLLIMPSVMPSVPRTNESLPGREPATAVAAIEATVAWSTGTHLGLTFRAPHELIDAYLRQLER